MAEHAKTPWSIGKCSEGSIGLWCPDGHFGEIYYDPELDSEDRTKDKEAVGTANLVIAAPDLLAALKSHVKWEATEDPASISDEKAQRYMAMMAATLAAIAKAEGEPANELPNL